MQKFKHGFSRPELLTVTAIASIALAMTFPTLKNAREAASKSQSHSSQNRDNLRAIYRATRQYMADNDSRFMPGGTHRSGLYWWGKVTSNTKVDYKRGPLYPYLKSVRVLRSPAFPVNLRPVIGGVAFGYNKTFLGGSFFEKGDISKKLPTARLSQIKNPRITILFADSARWNSFRKGAAQLEENVFLGTSVEEKFPTFHGRHNGYGHALFLDGHIAAFKPQAGSVPKNWNGPADLGHLPDIWFDRN